MMKEEFENLIGEKVDSKDYKVIEFVYCYHPSIPAVEGKKQIAAIYKIGGMRLINDMVPTATRIKQFDEAIEKKLLERDLLDTEITALKQERELFRGGNE